MKKFKYIILFFLSVVMLNSCNVFDKESILDANAEGSNLVSFESPIIIYSQVATGDEYTFEVQVKVKGPTVMDMTGDVPVTIEIADITTAVAGTHYRIDNTTLTLTKDNNYLGKFEVTMVTAGIVAPLDQDPVLALNATTSGSSEDVVGNGLPTEISLVYGCLSHFEGDYDVTTVYTATDGTVSTLNWTETITKTGVEEYRTGRVGHWTQAQLGGTPGYTFYNKCDDLTIPGQLLVDTYGNWVLGYGSVDDATGVIHVEYSICFPAGGDVCRYYVSDYVPVP